MPGSLSKKLPIVLFFFLVFCFLVLVWKSQVVVAWESGCYYCGSYSGGVLQEPPKKFTNEAIEKMKKEGCKTVGTCNALSAGWELVGYTQPDGSIVYDCVGSGCCTGTSCDDREGGGGSGGSSFSCGRLVPPRCRDLLPIYSEDGDPYLAQGKEFSQRCLLIISLILPPVRRMLIFMMILSLGMWM